jgi:hypothetical protein
VKGSLVTGEAGRRLGEGPGILDGLLGRNFGAGVCGPRVKACKRCTTVDVVTSRTGWRAGVARSPCFTGDIIRLPRFGRDTGPALSTREGGASLGDKERETIHLPLGSFWLFPPRLPWAVPGLASAGLVGRCFAREDLGRGTEAPVRVGGLMPVPTLAAKLEVEEPAEVPREGLRSR